MWKNASTSAAWNGTGARTLNGAPVLIEEIETLHLFDGEHRLLMVDQILETDRPALGKRNLYRYTLSNHLGSSTVEVDENADIISYEEYHPYGTTAYQSGRNAAEVKLKRYRYTGMERDEESGLSYHGARYYAPWLGRWMSCDPGGLVDSSNLYAYVRGNPAHGMDPTGTQRRVHARFIQTIQRSSRPNFRCLRKCKALTGKESPCD